MDTYPVRLAIDHPERLSRLLIFVKWLLAIPHFIALFFLAILLAIPVAIVSALMMYVAYAVVVIGWFVILFTARFPAGLFKIVVVALRWQTNVNFYAYWMTRVYPPLSWD